MWLSLRTHARGAAAVDNYIVNKFEVNSSHTHEWQQSIDGAELMTSEEKERLVTSSVSKHWCSEVRKSKRECEKGDKASLWLMLRV